MEKFASFFMFVVLKVLLPVFLFVSRLLLSIFSFIYKVLINYLKLIWLKLRKNRLRKNIDDEYVVSVKYKLFRLNEELKKEFAVIDNVLSRVEGVFDYSENTSIIDNLKSEMDKIRGINSKIGEARKLSDRLKKTNDRYERKVIHEECKNIFGDGSPDRVISKLEREANRAKNNMGKMLSRRDNNLKFLFRNIDVFIVDGSNIVHGFNRDKGAEEFIGFDVLIDIIRNMKKIGNVFVYFDDSIYFKSKKYKINANEKIDYIKRMNVDVVISDPGKEADLYILNKAKSYFDENKCRVSILSRDKFLDYKEFKSVIDFCLATVFIFKEDGKLFYYSDHLFNMGVFPVKDKIFVNSSY